ncbi:unnamed protein product [Boreogadus saida]
MQWLRAVAHDVGLLIEASEGFLSNSSFEGHSGFISRGGGPGGALDAGQSVVSEAHHFIWSLQLDPPGPAHLDPAWPMAPGACP